MQITRCVILMVVVFSVSLAACGGDDAGEEPGELVFGGNEVDFKGLEPKVWFIEPVDGAEVASPFIVQIGSEGLLLQGTRQAPTERYGHHHMMIDASIPPLGEVIPNDDQHVHFHRLETEKTLNLPPGQHTLTLVFGTTRSHPYEPLLTEQVTINVIGQRRVFFVQPEDEAQIREQPYTIKIGSESVDESLGHYVVVFAPFPLPPEGEPVPVDDEHIHLDPGQTELTMELPQGGAPLHVIFADAENKPVGDPPLYSSVNIVVWGAPKIEGEEDAKPAFQISGRD